MGIVSGIRILRLTESFQIWCTWLIMIVHVPVRPSSTVFTLFALPSKCPSLNIKRDFASASYATGMPGMGMPQGMASAWPCKGRHVGDMTSHDHHWSSLIIDQVQWCDRGWMLDVTGTETHGGGIIGIPAPQKDAEVEMMTIGSVNRF